MIYIRKALKAFDEYVKKYNPKDEKIMLKINHIKRVSKISRNMATSLNLLEEDKNLAELIGILHDIGRFEQIRLYNTFLDRDSVNHGELGVKILFEDGLIRNFIKDTKYDDIIKKSILNHNRGIIEEGLTQKELLHAKIIRDSDKTDIYNVLINESVEACYNVSNMSKEIITKEIYREFKEEHIINYKNIQTAADVLVAHFAYVFDYNFSYGLKLLEDKKYLDSLYNKFKFEDVKTQERFDEVYKIAKNYVIDRVK